MSKIPSKPRILTTTVGSYPVPDWLAALPSEQAVIDATRVVFDLQRQAGIDLPTDGELYRFDVNHPDTNGMIEYFIRPMKGVRSEVGRGDLDNFAKGLIDSIVENGIIDGDSSKTVRKLTLQWGSVIGARVEISSAPAWVVRKAVA